MSWLKLDTDVHKIFSCKVSFNCCCQVDSWLLIKNFEHRCDQVLSEWYFREKNITTTEVVFIQLLSYKNENTEWHDIFIPFKSQVNSKQGSFIYLLLAVIQRCSVKKVFLEILQNLQQNTCARVSFFNKVADLMPKACNFITVIFM